MSQKSNQKKITIKYDENEEINSHQENNSDDDSFLQRLENIPNLPDSLLLNLKNVPIPLNEILFEKSTKITIENVDVYFPFQPYGVQVDYMSNVIKTLKSRGNALLQSPTGTGKTLSLLCASLAWLTQYKIEAQKYVKKPLNEPCFVKIIYASRTHSQLKQVLKELKNTVFQPQISVQASKDHLCIKQEFRGLKGGILSQACRTARKNIEKLEDQSNNEQLMNTPPKKIQQNTCSYYDIDQITSLAQDHNRRIMDIEELREYGQNHGVCPFFFERERKKCADLILMPYNYLLGYIYLFITRRSIFWK